MLKLNLFRKKDQQMNRNIWLIGTPEYGNLGDHQISESSHQFLKDHFPQKKIIEITMDNYWEEKDYLLENIKQNDILFFHGGGNIGTLWPKSELIRRDAFQIWNLNNKIVLPQSIFFEDGEKGKKELELSKKIYSGNHVILTCRERTSYHFAKKNFNCKVLLTPDMVLYSKNLPHSKKDQQDAILCLRKDKEKILKNNEISEIKEILTGYSFSISEKDTVISNIKVNQRQAELERFYSTIAGAQLVVTDRLHAMVFCALLETPCVVFPNSYHKLSGVYEWIKDLCYIKLITEVSELNNAIDHVMAADIRKYPGKGMRKNFNSLMKALEGL